MKKFFNIILFILIGLFIIFVIYFIYLQLKLIWSESGGFPIVSPIQNSSFDEGVNSIPKDIEINNPALNGLDRTLENIRQASLDNNISLINQFYSAPTLAYYAASGGGRIIKTYLKDVKFSNIRKISAGKVLVTISQVEMSGHSESQTIVFVREKDGWKMGVVETKEYFK